jgi:ABC-type glycerol-3-phosphate transport system permease component
MVTTSIKPTAQIYSSTPIWIPNLISLENFRIAWDLIDLPRYLANSVLISGLALLGNLASSSLVGYAFATLSARGKNLIFNIMLGTMMIPASVTLIPTFILFSELGWVDTFLPLIVPQYFANVFYVFLFRQFFRSLPPALFESAELDGCHPLATYWYIALPLARPALATVAVFSLVNSWNDFLGPLVYLNSPAKYTVSLGLAQFQGFYYTQLEYLMPMSLVALLPLVIIFLVAQRYFVQGIVTTGLKG